MIIYHIRYCLIKKQLFKINSGLINILFKHFTLYLYIKDNILLNVVGERLSIMLVVYKVYQYIQLEIEIKILISIYRVF